MPYSTSANRPPSMSNFEKSVKGGTKAKLAPPKSKYVEHILLATKSGDAGVAEVFRTLTLRLRDSTWIIAFKSLIIVHYMIKEGAPDVTLRYLAASPRNRLAISSFADVQSQGQNIRAYYEYLLVRAQAYEKGKCDYARSGEARMKALTVDKGLLFETEVVQNQIRALLKCELLTNEAENEISLTAFRLLTRDLLDLYNVENEAVMNVLSHYFEMTKTDAERAITIYKRFCKQTEEVVLYLGVARQYEHATRLEIPKLKHAPTSLAASLQEYLDDKDFEINRRQYLAEQQAKRTGTSTSKPPAVASQPSIGTKTATPFDEPPVARLTGSSQPTKGPAPDLIDFFASIDQNQQTMQTNPFLQQQPQPTALQQPQQIAGYQQPPQQYMDPYSANAPPTNPYMQQQIPQQDQVQPLHTQYTGAGFGGYGPQPSQQSFATGAGFGQDQQPQQQYTSPAQLQSAAILQQQPTNPFRVSMLAAGTGGGLGSFGQQAQQQIPERSGTNPFSRGGMSAIPENSPTPPPLQQQQQQPMSSFTPQPAFQAPPLQSQPTGTNPFARNQPPSQQPTPPMSPPNSLQVQATGSTNPFRQSMFVNQQTGAGWQNGPQGTMGGLENLETVPIFPRPGQVTGQTTQQSPWG